MSGAASEAVDVAVIGGGVIGLSVAYHAAKRGARVTLFEAGEFGGGASGAAAGMLNAQAEAHAPGPMLDLMLKSRQMHHALSEELFERTGLDPEHVWDGTIRISLDEPFAEELRRSFEWQKETGLSARWLSGEEVRKVEPAVSPEAVAGLQLPEDGQVNSGRFVRSLSLAAAALGAEVVEGERVVGFSKSSGKVSGVRTVRREVPAGSVVLAGGSSSPPLAEELGLKLAVHPVKGEVLRLRAGNFPLGANVWSVGCYVVPKRDGRVIVGATEEPNVFDRRPTLGGVAKLSSAAARLLPALEGATFCGAWGGLRPGTPDDLPVLGPVEGLEGLLLATGTYRNGILLSPAVGEEVSALALGEEASFDLAPFAPERVVGKV